MTGIVTGALGAAVPAVTGGRRPRRRHRPGVALGKVMREFAREPDEAVDSPAACP